jgi:putative cell wall-binding protein
LAISGLTVALTASPAAAATSARIGGANRYDTARLAALATFPSGSATAVLATGENFPDALSASTLAGALGAPILLTPTAGLAPETVSALATLHVHTVQIVGGPAAVSPAVIAQLTGLGYTVPTAIAGATRYDTAAAIAAAATASAPVGTLGGKKTAIIATGQNFPDALAAGSASFFAHFPVLLTTTATLSAQTSAAITTLGITNVLIAGGPAAVSAGVETSLKALAGGALTTTRLAGITRFETSVAWATFDINAVIAGGLGMSAANVILASGLNFPDALVGAEFAAPIVLNDTLPPSVATFLGANSASIKTITALGGTAAVSDADLAAAVAATTPTAGTATIAAVAGGTSFTVTFSAAAKTPVAANFTLNNGMGGAGIGVPAATGVPNQFLVPITGAPLKPGDIIAGNAANPPTNSAGVPFAVTSFTVPANAAPTVVSTLFQINGKALAITFSKPVTTVGGAGTPAAKALSAISVSGGVVLTAGANSADDTTLEYTSGTAFTAASVLTIVGGSTGGVANGIEDQSTPPVPLAATFTTTPSNNTVAPSIQAIKVSAGTPVQGTLPVTGLTAPDTLTISAKPGSAADGANGALFKVATLYAVQPSVTVAVATVSGVTTFTVTIPKGASAATPVSVAAALNASAPFNTVLVANGTGAVDFSAATAMAASALGTHSGVAGMTVQDLTVVLNQPVVPVALLGTLTVNATDATAGLGLGTFGNSAAPSALVGELETPDPAAVIVPGTTTISYVQPGTPVVNFANIALAAQTVTSS